MQTARKYSSPIIARVLARITPEERERTRRTMLLAARIDDAIQAKGWTKKGFAEVMGKRPSEVSRWLSGTHNFTLETLYLIEEHLGVTLFVVAEEVLQPV